MQFKEPNNQDLFLIAALRMRVQEPVLELCSGGVHVGDHGSDVTDDGGEDEDANQEVDGYK